MMEACEKIVGVPNVRAALDSVENGNGRVMVRRAVANVFDRPSAFHAIVEKCRVPWTDMVETRLPRRNPFVAIGKK